MGYEYCLVRVLDPSDGAGVCSVKPSSPLVALTPWSLCIVVSISSDPWVGC